jgi:hypothetical protein
VLNGPPEYTATATVAGPLLISRSPASPYETSNGAREFVADFTAALSLPTVVDATAARVGASPQEIRDNSSATPIGQSALVQVRYVTTKQATADPVVRALALETVEYLFRPAAEARALAVGADTKGIPPIPRLTALLELPETITLSATEEAPRGPRLIRAVELAVATGLLLALLVVILLERLPIRRRRRKAKSEPSSEELEETVGVAG